MILESTWNGFRRIDFEFMGRKAILVFPNEGQKCDKWLLKTEYFDAFPELEIEMVKRGWHLAYVSNVTRWCLDEDLDVKKAFAEYLNHQYGLEQTCVPVGMSCGGMIAVKFAAKYSECVTCIYIDAPVIDLTSCFSTGETGERLYQEFRKATGMTMEDLPDYREQPKDMIPILLERKIPVMMVYGKVDTVVPYDENGALLEHYYTDHRGILKVIGKEECGHHPHGLEDNSPIVEFILKYS